MEIDYSKLRYILDEDGYIFHASIGGLIVCDLGQCTEYDGTIPEGYETIVEWYDNEIEKLNAWKVIEGNLVFDENKYNELQVKWEKEAEENSLSTHKWVKSQIHKSNSVVADELSNNVKGSSLVVLKDSGNYEIPNVSISGNVDEVKVISSNRNILGINAVTKTIDGVTFDINSDGSITLNGVATKDIEFDLNGSNSNQEMLFLLKNNTDYMISGLTNNVSLYLYNFDGTDRTLIESCQNGLLNYSNSYKVTYVTLFIKSGSKFSRVTLYPQIELSNYVSEFIKHEENVVKATLYEKEATITTLTSYDPLTIVMVDENVNINVDYYKYKSIEEQLAKIENNIENILLSVSNKVDYSNTIKNRDYIHITNNNDNYPSLFKIKGDLHTLYPQEDLYPSEDLFPDDASYSEENEQYKYVSLVIDKEETPTKDIVRIPLPLNYLNKFEDTYDEFIVENGVCSIIRRIGVNEYGSKYVLEETITEDRGTLDIPLFDGTNYIYLEDYKTEGLTFEITYAIHNEYTDEFATKKEVSASIDVSANTIKSEIAATYSTKEETLTAKQEAIDGANETTDNKLAKYSTTIEMNNAITQQIEDNTASISSSISAMYSTKEETINAKNEAISSANDSTDNKLKNYSTTTEMNNAITQKVTEAENTINIEVAKKVNNDDYTSANIIAKINGDTSEVGIKADKIILSAEDILNLIAGNEINLTSKNITIKSNNFSVDKNGNCTANSINITGGNISGTKINLQSNGTQGALEILDNSGRKNYVYGQGMRIESPEGKEMVSVGANSEYGQFTIRNKNNSSQYIQGDLSDGRSKITFKNSDGNTTEVRGDSVSTPKISAGNMAWGQGTCNSNGYTWINFNKTFPNVPRVVATPNTSTNGVIAIKIRNVSTTGFEATLGGTNFGNEKFDWIAISN